MKKLLKTAGKVLIGTVLAIVLFLVIVFIYHRIMLEKEKPLFEDPPGTMTEVDGHNMCVYTEGEGEHTLLFLSGSGTASPILDFRSLYRLLNDDYRIVVIEKFGYGFSDIVDTERSFDTILRQDREALAKNGIEGPFILCPHSMSGLEAILWAQKYPDEVEAIVGLDMVNSHSYDNFDISGNVRQEKLLKLFRDMGLARLFYSDPSLPASLTKDEKALYRAIGSKIAVNEDITNEALAIPDGCAEINSAPKPDVPTLLFVSNGKDVGIENWADNQKDYAEGLTISKVIQLDCTHYVHDFEQERIASEMREFLTVSDR